ncbi:calcium/calmodulin-dependent protein kinase type II delta chain isoform X16 [Oopsacas minuta]|uniref:calcium/calmodulin-dependent protein kinase n=1 Tax=Oopsacas minuta TaxID=111878 RepID=A0AAV7JTH3_9METZ|nr:calcium/calmodulin-dependent protein kinase type II delta chain isoform X16 [Oopsacas minuta]
MDKDISEFYGKYHINEELGQGRFSVVKRCTLKCTEKSFAMKIVKNPSEYDKKNLKKETDILLQLEHKHIVRIHDFFTNSSQSFIILDYLSGGDLFEEIIKHSYYSERDASTCIQQVLEAVEYCHSIGIIHRDLKPENLLLSQSKGIWIKIVDFGLAVQLDKYERFWFGFAGTMSYLSPEIINRIDYGKGVDIWACGVILYILLCGYPPFANEDQRELFGSITSGKYEFHSPEWDTVTPKARDIIQSMLTMDQDNRPTASSLLTHPWVRERMNIAGTENREETIGALRRFIAKRKLKNTVQSIMTINRGSIDGIGQRLDSSKPVSHVPLRIQPAINRESVDHTRLSVDSTDDINKRILDLTHKIINLETNEYLDCKKSTEFRVGIPCIITARDKPLNESTSSTHSHKHSILHPIFHTLSQDAVCVAYIHVCTNYSDSCAVHTNVKSFKETRVWQRIGTDWVCLHCHSSET